MGEVVSLGPQSTARARRSSRTWLIRAFVAALWGVVVTGGFAYLGEYKATPGLERDAVVGTAWPIESSLPRRDDRATLVMFAHPQCACTRASISEFAKLMAQIRDQVMAHVVFLNHDGADWNDSDNWKAASAIAGVTTSWDDGGREATRFGARTSGQTMLYDRSGRLTFSGGITPSRGHEGENIGSHEILALVRGRSESAVDSRVFGCALGERRQE